MRYIDESKFKEITDAITKFKIETGRTPTQRELAPKVSMGKSCLAKYILIMQSKGLIEGKGRYILTEDIKLIAVPIVDSLYNHLHIYDKANTGDYIFISRKLYGSGEYGIVRAIDNSMVGANIRINNYIMVRRQKEANFGQIVLAKVNERYYLRRYIFDEDKQLPKLTAETNDEIFANIENFEIRGVAVSVIARIND